MTLPIFFLDDYPVIVNNHFRYDVDLLATRFNKSVAYFDLFHRGTSNTKKIT